MGAKGGCAMKKLITLTLSVGMLACLLAGCKKETPLTPTRDARQC